MKCSNCGSFLKEGMAFCPNCGFPVEQKVNNNQVNQMPDLMAPMASGTTVQGVQQEVNYSSNNQASLNNNSNVYLKNDQVNQSSNLMSSASVNENSNNMQQGTVTNTQTSNLNYSSGYTNPNSNIQPNSNFVNNSINVKNNINSALSYTLGVISLFCSLFINVIIGIVLGLVGIGVSFYDRSKGNLAGAKKGLIFNAIAVVVSVFTLLLPVLLPLLFQS